MKRVVSLIILVLSICNTASAQKPLLEGYRALRELPAIRIPPVLSVPIVTKIPSVVKQTEYLWSGNLFVDNNSFLKNHKWTNAATDMLRPFFFIPNLKTTPNQVFQLQVSPFAPDDVFIDRGFVPEKHNVAPSGTSDGIGTFEVEQNNQEREKLRDKILRWKHLMNTEMELDPVRISHIKLNSYGEKAKKLTA